MIVEVNIYMDVLGQFKWKGKEYNNTIKESNRRFQCDISQDVLVRK